MSTLRTLKRLILGETWLLPIGIAVTLVAAGVLRSVVADDWAHVGGFVLLAAVLVILLASTDRSARKR